MKDIFLQPQVVAAVIAGIFAIACKVLENRTRPDTAPARGFFGWFILIAAAASVILSLYSIGASRRQLSSSTWSEADRKGTIVVGDTLICHGYFETTLPDVHHREITISFPEDFHYVPTITDSIWPQGRGIVFNAWKYEVSPRSFKVYLYSPGTGSSDVVRYNWVAVGRRNR